MSVDLTEASVRVLQSLGSIDKKAYRSEKTCNECGKKVGSGLMHTKKQNW